MSDPTIDVAIVGGGVVGLAAACAVAARRPHDVRARTPAPPGAGGEHALQRRRPCRHLLPAGLAEGRPLRVEGRERLYAFCADHGVPCERCGKLIVAAADRIGALEALVTRGHANGLTDLELVQVGPSTGSPNPRTWRVSFASALLPSAE